MRKRRITFDTPRRHRQLSPLALTSIVASLAVILLAVAALLFFPRMGIFAAGTPSSPT